MLVQFVKLVVRIECFAVQFLMFVVQIERFAVQFLLLLDALVTAHYLFELVLGCIVNFLDTLLFLFLWVGFFDVVFVKNAPRFKWC